MHSIYSIYAHACTGVVVWLALFVDGAVAAGQDMGDDNMTVCVCVCIVARLYEKLSKLVTCVETLSTAKYSET